MLSHLRSNAIAYLALLVALSGSAYAATQIGSKEIANNSVRGKDIKKNTVAGSDLKDGSVGSVDVRDASLGPGDVAPDSLGGPTVDESALATVPDAAALDGEPAASFGSGIVSGRANGIAPSVDQLRPPFGISTAPTTGNTDSENFAIAPVALRFSHFVARGTQFGAAGEQIAIALAVDPAGAAPAALTPLCTPSVFDAICEATTELAIPAGSTYWLSLDPMNLSPPPSDLAFAYRLRPAR